jgi:hypothetical protein
MSLRRLQLPHPQEAVKKFNGRGALRRVRDGKPNTDAEHRVPTGSRLYNKPDLCVPCPRGTDGY